MNTLVLSKVGICYQKNVKKKHVLAIYMEKKFN